MKAPLSRLIANGRICATGEVVAVQVPESLMPGKGHSYAIVVADLDQRRPIWLGGHGRTEQDMQMFFDSLGTESSWLSWICRSRFARQP